MDAGSNDEGENDAFRKVCLECSRRPQPPSSNEPDNSYGNNARETSTKDAENKGSDSEDEDIISKEGNNVGIPKPRRTTKHTSAQPESSTQMRTTKSQTRKFDGAQDYLSSR
jgi:hypothetical protein